MRKPTRSGSSKKPHAQARAAGWIDPLAPRQPLISVRWLLSALGVVIAAALLCAYATFCLLFYQGSWQLLFHPSRTVSATPGVPYREVQFDYTETGKPQLTGWWIPADANARYEGNTILYLHDGRGSLSDTVKELEALHSIGINVFAFDYRGFGKSASFHPSEVSMNKDADAALTYLTGMRRLTEHSVILYGTGIGASVAAATAKRHPEVRALTLENIGPDALSLFAADARTKILPVRLLTSDRFDPSGALKTLQMPKLFIERGNDPQTHNLFTKAAMPRQYFQIAPEDQTQYLETLQRFLDELPSHP